MLLKGIDRLIVFYLLFGISYLQHASEHSCERDNRVVSLRAFAVESASDRSSGSADVSEIDVTGSLTAEQVVRWASEAPEGVVLLDALRRSYRDSENAISTAEEFFNDELAKQGRYISHLEDRVQSERDRARRWKAGCCGTGCLGVIVLGALGCLGYIG